MATLMFGAVACSDSDDDANLPEDKASIVGTWDLDGSSLKLGSDGSAVYTYEDGDYDSGTYTLTGDILTTDYTTYTDEDGEPEDDAYSEYYFIYELSDDEMTMAYLGWSYDDDGSMYYGTPDDEETTKEAIMGTTKEDAAKMELDTVTKK